MILSCQNVSKAFGTEEILKKVSFHVEENEKTAIVGINGAGKSDCFKQRRFYQGDPKDVGNILCVIVSVYHCGNTN